MEVPENADLVLVSDVHLRGTSDPRYLLLCELIKSCLHAKPKYFILLGDIFDFFFGRQKYYIAKYAGLKALLEQLADSGTQVLYFEGNHEFHLGDHSWKNVQIITDPTKVITLNDGRRIALAHGDLVYAPTTYLYFRAFVKSKFVRFLVSLLPPVWLENYALQHARVSRASDSYRKLKMKDLVAASATWIQSNEADIGIIGHFHIPFNELAGNAGQLLSVNAWDKMNFLCLKGEDVTRGYYQKERGWSLAPAPISNYASTLKH